MTVWDSLVGQESAVATLRDAAGAARRIVEGAQEGASTAQMTHAWLITGPPGSGRSVAARAFAAALQCTGPQPGCGECRGCETSLAGTNGDVLIQATDQSIIRVADVRSLVERAYVAPSQGRWRVLIVEDADRMQKEAANALLKAIEEPPARTVWLLCAPATEDMIPTIRSRCRHLGLRIPPVETVADYLVRSDGLDPQVALEAARAAQSHIGLARALAADPEMRERRRTIVTAPLRVSSVGEAVFAAEDLLEAARAQADARTVERDTAEKAELMRSLGMEEGERIDPKLRSMVKQLEEDQKRRGKRALTDELDRAMIDLLSLYRDVLSIQLWTGQQLVNGDLADTVSQIAQTTPPESTLVRIAAVEQARKRLQTNAAPQLVLESLMLQLLRA